MEESLEKRLRELSQRVWNQGIYSFTHFLDLAGISTFQAMLPSLPPVPWQLFGGAPGCERQMLRLGNEELCGYEASFPIVCLLLAPAHPKFAEQLAHRDYLGALMALGIEREFLGDIAVRPEGAYLFCEEHIAPYLQENMLEARHTALRCSPVAALPEGPLFQTQRKTVQLSSQRLDALIAHVYHLSRGQAQNLFSAGKIFVQGKLCLRPDAMPNAGEIVSVRGTGRFQYVGVESQSKKGKDNTAVDLYI